ncbi:MAG: DUF1049 domain-containing protein [Bradyrhizobiaceae bacterium]|nr:MAG: DUF1049 domain-containing protein [Bradyrhizobiaceae bacterium]
MSKFLKTLVIAPIALVLLAFAVANRHLVMVSFNPFDSADASLALTLPLFIVIIAAAIIGVIAGGIATWVGQRHWRRSSRRHEAEAYEARQRLAELTARIPQVSGERFGPGAAVPAGPYPGSLPAIGQDKPQDKPGAAL